MTSAAISSTPANGTYTVPHYSYTLGLPPPPRFPMPDDSPSGSSGNTSGSSASSSPTGSPVGSPSLAPQRAPMTTAVPTIIVSSNPAPRVLRICFAEINARCAGGCGNAHVEFTQIEAARTQVARKSTYIVCQFHQSRQCRWGDRCPNLHVDYTLVPDTARLETERAPAQTSAPSTPPRAPGPRFTRVPASDPTHLASRRARCTSGDAPHSSGSGSGSGYLDMSRGSGSNDTSRASPNRSSSRARTRHTTYSKSVRQPQVLHDLSLTRGKFTDLHKVALLLEELTTRTGSTDGIYAQNRALAENFQAEAISRVRELNFYLDKCLEKLGAFHQAAQQHSPANEDRASDDKLSPTEVDD